MLVLSNDALAAALLGALLEIEGCRVAFMAARESPRDALRRLRPCVVFIDVGYAEACCAAVIGPARMMRAGVVLFGGRRAAERLRERAQEHDAQLLLMPPVLGELRGAIDRASAAVR